MFPLPHIERQLNPRPKRLLSPIIRPRIEPQLPDGTPARLVVVLLNQALDRGASNLRIPFRNAPVAVGHGGEGRGWRCARCAGERYDHSGCGTAGCRVEDVAGYGVFGCHCWCCLMGRGVGEVGGESLESKACCWCLCLCLCLCLWCGVEGHLDIVGYCKWRASEREGTNPEVIVCGILRLEYKICLSVLQVPR